MRAYGGCRRSRQAPVANPLSWQPGLAPSRDNNSLASYKETFRGFSDAEMAAARSAPFKLEQDSGRIRSETSGGGSSWTSESKRSFGDFDVAAALANRSEFSRDNYCLS